MPCECRLTQHSVATDVSSVVEMRNRRLVEGDDGANIDSVDEERQDDVTKLISKMHG